MRRFDLVMPKSVEECVRTLAERGADAKIVAGGPISCPQMKNGMLRTGCVVDLSGVAQLRQLASANGSGLRIGAAVTARTLERDPRRPDRLLLDLRERRAGRVACRCGTWRRSGESLQRRSVRRHGARRSWRSTPRR